MLWRKNHPTFADHMSRRAICVVCAVLCAWSTPAHAQLDLGVLQAHSPHTAFSHYSVRGTDIVPLIVHVPTAEASEAGGEGLVALSQGLYAAYRKTSELSDVMSRHKDWHFIWSPSRHLLLDHAVPNIHGDIAYQSFARRGANVIVGIVDTGVDLTHPDLRTADGKTRVAWYLDLAQSKPFGAHPDLETTYGCSIKTNGNYSAPCAVFNADDINRLLASAPTATFPVDTIGHGTHVASLAGGNGLSNSPPQYVGVAPEAQLVIVNATRHNVGDLQDADIILGTKFVFDVAEDVLKLPAVVNLSLGSDAGSHDGTSDLEQALSSFVGPDIKGRAIVVAAGNSADLFDAPAPYPQFLGIHTSVQVLPDGNTTRLPILVDASAEPDIDSTFYAWVQMREGDDMSVGVETESGGCIAPISGGTIVDKTCGDTEIILYTGITGGANGGSPQRPAVAMQATGKFASPKVFALTFKGSGTAFVWMQSNDGLNPALPTLGALVPSATRERTVAIPATATGLIAVGATLNRIGWTDIGNAPRQLKSFGSDTDPFPLDVAPFSGAGPNQLDDMKPDILAPGGYVVGAMATLADPRVPSQAGGMFDGTGVCPDNTTISPPECPDGKNDCLCYLIDNKHAVAVGTSMASPLVAGAIALLFEGDPTLTQTDVRRYIQAGAQKNGAYLATLAQESPGSLDVNGALLAQSNDSPAGGSVDPFASWLSVSTALVHPDNQWSTQGALHLRDASNHPVTIDPSHINVVLSPGFLLGPIQPEGYGYYTFSFAAGDGTGRETMEMDVQVDQRTILKETLYIGVDVASTRGYVIAGRGCNIVRYSSRNSRSFWGISGTLAALCLTRRSLRRSASLRRYARAVKSLDERHHECLRK